MVFVAIVISCIVIGIEGITCTIPGFVSVLFAVENRQIDRGPIHRDVGVPRDVVRLERVGQPLQEGGLIVERCTGVLHVVDRQRASPLVVERFVREQASLEDGIRLVITIEQTDLRIE